MRRAAYEYDMTTHVQQLVEARDEARAVEGERGHVSPVDGADLPADAAEYQTEAGATRRRPYRPITASVTSANHRVRCTSHAPSFLTTNHQVCYTSHASSTLPTNHDVRYISYYAPSVHRYIVSLKIKLAEFNM